MKTITLLHGTIELSFGPEEGGSIVTGLERETCPICNLPDCCFSCDMSKAEHEDAEEPKPQSEDEVAERLKFNGGLDALESMLLAAACAGLLATSEDPRWNEIIQTTMDALGNND